MLLRVRLGTGVGCGRWGPSRTGLPESSRVWDGCWNTDVMRGQGVGGRGGGGVEDGKGAKAEFGEPLLGMADLVPGLGSPVSLGSLRFPRRKQTYSFFPDNQHTAEKEA